MASKDDGSFQIAVPPGKGHLMVLGPTLDYIPREIGGGELYGRRPARRPALLRPRHHRLRRQGRRRAPRGHRDPEAGQDARAAASSGPAGETVDGRGHPHPATDRARSTSSWRAMQLHPRPRRPLRAARLRPGEGRAGLLPRRRARVGRGGRALRQAGRRGPDDPAPAVRPGEGAVRRARRQARRQAQRPCRTSRS